MGWGLIAAAGSVLGLRMACSRSEPCLRLPGNRAPDMVPEFRGSRVCVCACVCVCVCVCRRVYVQACSAPVCLLVHMAVCMLCAHVSVCTRACGRAPALGGSPVSPPFSAPVPLPACCCGKHTPSPLPGGRNPGWAQVRGWFLSPKSQGVFFSFPFSNPTQREWPSKAQHRPRVSQASGGSIPGIVLRCLRLKTP